MFGFSDVFEAVHVYDVWAELTVGVWCWGCGDQASGILKEFGKGLSREVVCGVGDFVV